MAVVDELEEVMDSSTNSCTALAKGLAAIFLVFMVFALPVMRTPQGMSAYLIPSIIWLTVFAVLWRDISADKQYTPRLLFLVPFAVVAEIAMDFMVGLIVGFGANVYVKNPLNIILNITRLIPIVLGVESFRYYMVRRIGGGFIKIFLVSLIIAVLYFSPMRYLSLGDWGLGINFILRTFIPILAVSIFLTQLAYWGGVKPAIMYSILTYIYVYMSPILPNTPWYLKPLIGIAVPLVQFGFIVPFLPLHLHFIRNFRKTRGTRKSKISKSLSYSLVGAAVILLAFIALGGRVMTVVSGSMEPQIGVGDIAVVVPDSDIYVGDIVAFKGPSSPILHRVIDVKAEKESTYYTTKGDANNTPDPYKISNKDIIGKLLFTIPYLGYPIVYGAALLGGLLNFATAIIVSIYFLYFYSISVKR